MSHDHVPPGDPGICRSCGAAIRWVYTSRKRAMPIDPVPVAGGNVEVFDMGTVSVVTPSPGIVRYVSHFATCPNAATHRKPKATALAQTATPDRAATIAAHQTWAASQPTPRVECIVVLPTPASTGQTGSPVRCCREVRPTWAGGWEYKQLGCVP